MMTRSRRNAVVCLGLVMIVAGYAAQAQTTSPDDSGERVTFTGKVVDAEGRPIAGAKVSLREVADGEVDSAYDVKLHEETTTAANGAFSLDAPRRARYDRGCVTAQRQGYAIGWAYLEMNQDQQHDLVLGEPQQLSGVVVDQDDLPVPEADVFVATGRYGKREEQQYLLGPIARRLLATTTDAAGRFTVGALPDYATFELGAQKAGYATMTSYDMSQRSQETLQFTPGQTDIKLTMPVEAKIAGRVVERDNGRPMPGVVITTRSSRMLPHFQPAPVISEQDGTFQIDALLPDSHTLNLARPAEELPDWIANPVTVTLDAGQVQGDVKIEACKGGILEVLVTEATTNKPISQASVSLSASGPDRKYFHGSSDDEGLARIRLMPGAYQLQGVYKQGYSQERRQETVTIEDGVTKRIARTLTGMPKIRGVARDPAGQPVEGATLKILPAGREEVRSDSEGRFEIIWDPGFWGDREETVFCLVARHEQRNLATATEIGEDTHTLDVELEPGVTLTGKVTDPEGKGIAGARVRTMLRLSNWGSTLTRDQAETDAEGNFQIAAIPPDHRYSLTAMADGFGDQDTDVEAGDAVARRLDAGVLSLPVANLSISGQVVDTQDEPVPNADINGYGDGQPSRCETESDAQGRFTLDGVCAGTIRLRVDARPTGKRLSAFAVTEGGASDVKIVVREGRGPVQYISGKTYEQIIAEGGKIIAGVAVDEDGAPVAGVPVGVCCHVKTREDGRTSWSYSSFSTLSDTTDEKGRFAIKLEEDGKYCLRFSPDAHAALIVYDVPVGTKDLKVTLSQGGTITGHLVRLEKGKKVPIPNVEVKLEQTDRTSYTHLGFERDRTTVADAQGRFRFEHVSTHMRPDASRSDSEWNPVPRTWQISYGETSQTIGFYDDPKTLDVELLVKPQLADAGPLLAKPLPAWDGIQIDLAPNDAKDKRLLVCFFDMNQRPSRHCVTQLSKKTQAFQEKGVLIVVVQAAEVEADAFGAWAGKYATALPAGRIVGDIDAVKYTWSVQSLPWLILTDKQHIVRAEGFGLNEIDTKLAEIADGQR